MLPSDLVHHDVQARIRAHRGRIPDRLVPAFDELIGRHGFDSDDPETFFNALIQPIVTFPMWVADATVVVESARLDHDVVLDLVEATVIGYLFVRVHDDLLDEGLGRMPEAMFLADSFLIRHGALLATHTSSSRFWKFHEATSAAYFDAMLLERELSRPDSHYTEADFDQVLRRSQPLVLPGALIFDLTDNWARLDHLQQFIHHAVRAGQLVDDILDCERDVANGNHTWVARRLGSRDAPEAMAERLVMGELDQLVAVIDDDLDRASIAADAIGMTGAVEWVEDRRRAVHSLAQHILLTALMG
jgi:hypothetical protein